MKQSPEYTMGSPDQIAGDLPDNQHDLDRMKSETAVLDLPEVKDIPGQEHIRVMPFGEMADTTISSADEEGAGILDFDEAAVGLNDDEIGPDGENSIVIAGGGDEDLEEEEEDDDADILNDDDPEEDYQDEDFITEDDDGDFDEDIDEDADEEVDEEYPRANVDPSSQQDAEDTDAEISDEELALLDNSGPVESGSDTDNLNRSKLDQQDFDGEVLNEVASTQNVGGNDLDVPGSELDNANEKIGEEDEENNLYSVADTDT